MKVSSRIALLVAAGAIGALLAPTAQAVDADAALRLARQSNCLKCHAVDKKKEGPSYQEVAAKFKGKPEAHARLVEHITSGEKVKFPDGHEEDHAIVKTKDKAQIDNLVDWKTIQPWARQTWVHDGKTYGVPQEAYTNEIYYNKDLLKKLGFELPANGQFTQSQFLDLVKKAKAAGITPIAQGVGDRPFPGAYIVGEALLRKLGKDDYKKLFTGKLSFDDPRVVAVLTWTKELVDAGAYPKNFMTLKLGESHYYFYSKPGALMLPMGSWYTGRAFVPEDKGGQPKDFPLGVMQFPAMDGGACNQCKTSGIGASFAINTASKHKELAAEFLNAMSTPAMGKRWIETIYLQSAVDVDVKEFSGPYASYFTELMARQKGEDYFIGQPLDMVQGQCKDTFGQVLNSGFPGGLVPVAQTVKMMNTGCFKG